MIPEYDRQWLANLTQGMSHPAGLPLSLNLIDNLEYLSTLVIADFSVSPFVQIKNRAGLVLPHQCNPVSLFSNLGQNAKHNLTNWFKTFLQPSSFKPKSTSTKTLWHKRISVFGKIFVVFRQLDGAKTTMCNEYVLEAKKMSEVIINQEFRGVGDTIEAAAYRAARKNGIDGKQLMRIRHRAHEMKDMRVSLWFSIVRAYQKSCDAAERLYTNERAKHEINSPVVRMADLVAGAAIPMGVEENQKGEKE